MKMDPERFATEMIRAFGGPLNLMESLRRRREEVDRVWTQDTDRIGKVLRSHLAVEYYLTMYLKKRYPQLEIDRTPLSYASKISLLRNDNLVRWIYPCLKQIGIIRNRMAHTPHCDLNDEDTAVFLADPMFSTLMQHRPTPLQHPLDVLEEYAKVAASLLQGAIDEDSEFVGRALDNSVVRPEGGEA